MNKLRLAVIGVGRLGGFHAQKLAAMENVELIGIVDPLPDARNRVAAECNTKAFANVNDLDRKVDAVIVATPTQLHHKVVLPLLENDVHAMVEKPICSTVTQANELVDAAKRNRVVLQVGHVERFNPAVTAAMPHVDSPKYIEAVRTSGFTFRSTDVGAILDLMIHDIDLVLSMVKSPVRRVEALGLSVLGGYEDVANARLEFECGCVAAISASRVSYETVRRLHVWSAQAFASIDCATRKTTLIKPREDILKRKFNIENFTSEQIEHYKSHLFEDALVKEEMQLDPVDALTLELKDFLESIQMPRSPRVTGEHGRDALEVAEQILAKIDSHVWDDKATGPVGPMALPRPSVIPAPHWKLAMTDTPDERKEAG